MTQGLLYRILICIFLIGGLFYLYVDKQNDLTELKIKIPKLVRALRILEEENKTLKFEIEKQENPEDLTKLLRQNL